MPEDATRRLLKQFGIAFTDFEDQTMIVLERLGALGSPTHSPAPALALAGEWLKTNGEVMAGWLEVTRLLVETQAKAQAEFLRVIGAAREATR
ncbi:MAG: hypothetical protein HYT85_04355 [candidate division NC10 bacterium]|nr:hypothetical protein [candidate division NC10 bacterium]